MEKKKVALIMPNWVGDCVMATILIEEIMNGLEGAEISLIIRHPLGELFEKDRRLKSIFSWSIPRGFFARRWMQSAFAEKIAAEHFDLVFVLSRSWLSRALAWKSAAPVRVGFGGILSRFCLTHYVKMPSKETKIHQRDLYALLLDKVQISHGLSKPHLVIDREDLEEGRHILERLHIDLKSPLVIISPSAAGGSAKMWPAARFRELIEKLMEQRCDLFILLVGESKARELCFDIVRDFGPRVIAFAGQTTLRELMALLSLSRVAVVNDSGPMHMAAALNIPLVALFGPTDPDKTGPSSGQVIKTVQACSPCHLRQCPIDHRCMQEIDVELVASKVLSYCE